jgi:hypothetical protein
LDLALMSRPFPPPWPVEETVASYIVRDANGQEGANGNVILSRFHVVAVGSHVDT